MWMPPIETDQHNLLQAHALWETPDSFHSCHAWHSGLRPFIRIVWSTVNSLECLPLIGRRPSNDVHGRTAWAGDPDRKGDGARRGATSVHGRHPQIARFGTARGANAFWLGTRHDPQGVA